MSEFVSSLFLAGALLCAAHSNGLAGQPTGSVLLSGSPAAGPFPGVVLFGFDNRAFPFTNHVETLLCTGQRPQLVLPPGPPSSHDESLLYYGTVIRIGEVFHLWYNANYGPMRPLSGFEREKCAIAYATSTDGVNWTKPNLGLVEFNGSKANNLVDFPDLKPWSTCAIIHEPEEPDPSKCFKMAYEAQYSDGMKFCVAYSADGGRWVRSPNNPRGPFLEMAGILKHQGLYYVNGQASPSAHHAASVRRLATFVSADFEHWSPIGSVGLDRGPDVTGPTTADKLHQYEEVHLGAGVWNRGNALFGI
jgi:hypothetical protein